MVQCVFARNCRLARLTCVEHVSLCVGTSDNVNYGRHDFLEKSPGDGLLLLLLLLIAKVETAVLRLQGGKEYMVATWRGELFPCRTINLLELFN